MEVEIPHWIKIVAALGPMITAGATILVGVAVAVVAYRQYRVANEKLVLDLFDKRFAVYEEARGAVRTFWNANSNDNKFGHQMERIAVLHDVGRRARFLFGDEVAERIKKTRDILIDASANESTPRDDLTVEERTQLLETFKRGRKEPDLFLKDMASMVEKYMRITRSL